MSFFDDVLPDAQLASSHTGVPISVILAQWAEETGYGTSVAFRRGHNYAGVSHGGAVDSYPDRAAGLAAYISTLSAPMYGAARGSDPNASAAALGQSPWAQSHYRWADPKARTLGGPGSTLLRIMRDFGLTRYDRTGGAGVDPTLASQVASAGSGTPDLFKIAIPIPGVPDIHVKARWVLEPIALAGGLTLVVLGLWRSVSSTDTGRALRDKAHQGAKAAAKAGEVAAA